MCLIKLNCFCLLESVASSYMCDHCTWLKCHQYAQRCTKHRNYVPVSSLRNMFSDAFTPCPFPEHFSEIACKTKCNLAKKLSQ